MKRKNLYVGFPCLILIFLCVFILGCTNKNPASCCEFHYLFNDIETYSPSIISLDSSYSPSFTETELFEFYREVHHNIELRLCKAVIDCELGCLLKITHFKEMMYLYNEDSVIRYNIFLLGSDTTRNYILFFSKESNESKLQFRKISDPEVLAEANFEELFLEVGKISTDDQLCVNGINPSFATFYAIQEHDTLSCVICSPSWKQLEVTSMINTNPSQEALYKLLSNNHHMDLFLFKEMDQTVKAP